MGELKTLIKMELLKKAKNQVYQRPLCELLTSKKITDIELREEKTIIKTKILKSSSKNSFIFDDDEFYNYVLSVEYAYNIDSKKKKAEYISENYDIEKKEDAILIYDYIIKNYNTYIKI
jgi:hypothetical protein